jgi:hypothetical protein
MVAIWPFIKYQISQILAVLKLLVKNIMILPFFDAEENGTFLAKSEQIWPFLIFEDLSCLRTAFAKFGLLNFFGAGNPASDILIYVNTER